MRLTPELLRTAPSYLNPLKQRELGLRGHQIPLIENLGITNDLYEAIDLSENEIVKVENFPRLPTLVTLLLGGNRIVALAPELGAALPALQTLVLSHNHLAAAADLAPLASLPTVTTLLLLGNPVTKTVANYRVLVAALLPNLAVLDCAPVTPAERQQAAAVAAKLKAGAALASFAIVNAPSAAAADAAAPAATAAAADSDTAAAVAAPKKKVKLTKEQKVKLLAKFEAATTPQEIAVLEGILQTGVFPPGFDLD